MNIKWSVEVVVIVGGVGEAGGGSVGGQLTGERKSPKLNKNFRLYL